MIPAETTHLETTFCYACAPKRNLHFLGSKMEASSALLMTLGAASLLVSWVLLLVISWKEDYAWGLFSTLLPPVGYFYGLFRLDKAGQTVALALLGWVLIFLGW